MVVKLLSAAHAYMKLGNNFPMLIQHEHISEGNFCSTISVETIGKLEQIGKITLIPHLVRLSNTLNFPYPSDIF